MKKHWKRKSSLALAILLLVLLPQQGAAVTMEQMMQSMDMLRGACQPKFKVTTEELDRMRSADFTMEHTKDLMCYTRCIAQMAGTVTKKGEFSATKAYAQLPIILPPEMLEAGKASVDACRDVQKSYKDSCEKIFYTTKCMAEVDPSKFTFP